MKPRLGPLVAIVLAWTAVRMGVLVPWPKQPARHLPKRMMARRSAIPSPQAVAASNVPAPIAQAEPLILPSNSIQHAKRSSKAFADRNQVAELPTANPFTETSANSLPAAFQGSSGIVRGYVSPQGRSRRPLTGSAWALINGTGGAVGVPSLGGSQAGMRLFLQSQTAPLAVTGRFSRALGRSGDTEVSAGYALRGHGLGLLVERRERLDTRDGAFVVTGYAGAYDLSLPGNLRFDGFAQGGVAGLRNHRWFADGQMRATRRVPVSTRLNFGVGGGAWASAQQGVRRVEAGPLVEARVRAGSAGVRIAGEYRFRLCGCCFYPRILPPASCLHPAVAGEGL
jgi:hypothetical protein